MNGKGIWLLLMLTLSIPCAGQALQSRVNGSIAEANLVQALEKEVPSLMAKADVPGLSIALIRDGKPYWNHGFGVKNSQTKEPVTAETVFEAASLSKPVFAYAVLKLVDQGKLDLDAPLNTYLPGNYDAGDDVRINKITARKVLSHTTGFPNWRTPRGAKTLPILFEPGERFSYSGEGFVYLSKVVEAITKMKFEDYVNESVLKPLGMASSSFEWQERYKPLKAYNHDFIGNPTGQGESNGSNAAGSLLTTTADYALFISAILNGSGLKKETRALMLTPQSTVNESCRTCATPPTGSLSKEVFWGLGVGLQKTADGTSFWHWGDNGNNKAFFAAFDKQKDGIVMLTNSANGLLILEDLLATSFPRKFPAVLWINVGRFDSPARVLMTSLIKQGSERAIADYKKRRASGTDQILDEARINSMGYDLLRVKKIDEAIALFTLNTQDFPKSSNVWDSLGEAYMVKGDKPKAIENYKKSLELDPNNKGAIENLKKLEQ